MSELNKSAMGMPLDEKVMVSFSEDKTEAYILFSEPKDGGLPLTPEKTKSAIDGSQIVYGLDKNLIEDLISGNRSYNKQYLIAMGRKAINGKDGKLEYMFNAGEKNLSPKLNEDGTADYRNLNLIEMVEKGNILARALPPTAGEKGIDVFERVVPAVDGKPVTKMPKGKNTVVSADGTELIADATGQIVMGKSIISVVEILEISGDIDNSTGNVDFNGSVVIYGNVKSGFRVTAVGNIDIKGSIEGAEIECMGNLVADKGILGMHKAHIKVGGSVYARMIQDATVEVGGDIASDGIMHCELKCGGRIELKGKKGVLVGGNTSCRKEIDAYVYGSPLGTHTEINVGLEVDAYEKYKGVMNDITKLKKQFEEISKDLIVMGRVDNVNTMPEFKKKSYIKSLYDAKEMQEALKEKQEEALELKTELEKYKHSGKIISQSVIYPGVNVQIGNSVMAVRDQLGKCHFLNHEGRVKIIHD